MLQAGACSCRRRRAARHAERLHEAWTQRNGRGGKRPAGRGPEAQAARRELELQEHLLGVWEKEWKGSGRRGSIMRSSCLSDA